MAERTELHSDVRALLALVPPPSRPIGIADEHFWRKAEMAVGVEYPVELKQVNQLYGSGFFDDFLWILNPAPQIDGHNLFTYGFAGEDAVLASNDIRPALPTVTPQALLPVAWTRNGDEFFHVTNASRPWKLVLLGTRGSGVEVYSSTLPGLLVGVLSRKIESELLDGQFDIKSPSFKPA